MRFKMIPLIAAACCLAVSAHAVPTEGYATTVSGRAHVEHEANGTRVYLDDPSSIAGFVPFGEKSTFPGLDQLDGRDVQITGVVDGKRQITLTDPDQIKVTD